MSEEKKPSAADVAKRAEDAIRNAEMLEMIARDAAHAAAQAREEAEQAKDLAKNTSKKKKKAQEALDSIQKAKSLKDKDSGADKKFILDYLQKNSWDLRRQIPNLYDIRFEDDPPRVVIEAVPGPGGPNAVKVPELIHNGVKLEVELRIKKPNAVMLGEGANSETNTIITEDAKPEEEGGTYHRSISGEGAKVLGITEALGPHSLDTASKNRESYAAWLKRHPSIKVR